MKKLREIVDDDCMLAGGIKSNASNHKCYNMYMPIETALWILNYGHIYLSNGLKWNDDTDKKMMEKKKVFARCFSYSTCENIALWILYGGEQGKKGAMLRFLPSIIMELIKSPTIRIGKFNENRFDEMYELSIDNGDYEIFMTDVIYVEECESKSKGKCIRVSLADEHVTVKSGVINHPDIFYKKYPWSYEKECRMVVRLSPFWTQKAENEGVTHVQLSLSDKSLRILRDSRLTYSPIFKGIVDGGNSSSLTGEVDINM